MVGCGARAAQHLAAAAGAGVPVRGVFSRDAARRAVFAERHAVAGFGSLRAMINTLRPEGVLLVTGPGPRAGLMEEVSALGVGWCLVEKPVATGVADWRRLAALERRAGTAGGTRFAVCHQFWFERDLVRLRDAVARAGWARRVTMDGAMNPPGQGTHTLCYGRSLVGPAGDAGTAVAWVRGRAWGWDAADPDHAGPAGGAAEVGFVNGATGVWRTGHAAVRRGADTQTVWQHVSVTAETDGGGAGGWAEFGPRGWAGGWRADFDGFSAADERNVAAQTSLLTALRTGRVPTSLAAARHEWKAVLAWYASALNGERVELRGWEPDPGLPERFRRAAAVG